LKLHNIPVNIPIKGIGETLSHVKYSTKATIKSRSSAFALQFSCLIISKLILPKLILPSRVFDRKAFDISNNLRLVDPQFATCTDRRVHRSRIFLSSIMRGSNQVKFRFNHFTEN